MMVPVIAQASSIGGAFSDPAFGGGLGGAAFYIPDSALLDSDAAAYIAAVEAADGQALEDDVKSAIDDFVVGCKADGIWSAIKSSAILAGARTLTGALTPLVGTAPTNFNFVSGDYDRKTGLKGDGSTKYLDSNRDNNDDPQDSKHLAVYISGDWLATGNNNLIGTPEGSGSDQGGSFIARDGVGNLTSKVNSNGGFSIAGSVVSNTFAGIQRNNSSQHTLRISGTTLTGSVSSTTPSISSINILGQVRNGRSPSRLAFYSIGEGLDLALFDARVSALITAIDGAIP